jgi:hypothetical protein
VVIKERLTERVHSTNKKPVKMFSASRAKALRSLAWSIDPSNDVEYIEAWKYSKVL